MSPPWWVCGIALVAFVLLLSNPLARPARAESPRPAEHRQTARAALDKVLAKAKAWHADAELIGVTAQVDDKGAADNGSDAGSFDGWNYTFRSASAKKRFIVRVYSGGLETQETDLIMGMDTGIPGAPVGGIFKSFPSTFVDSDQAMTEARKNGFAGKGGAYHMALANVLTTPAAPKEPNCWEIIDEENTSFMISAKTGKLVWKGPSSH